MSQKVVQTLVCANCLNASPLGDNNPHQLWCGEIGEIVDCDTPFCNHFKMDTSKLPRRYRYPSTIGEAIGRFPHPMNGDFSND
jgi:hypothetical protein